MQPGGRLRFSKHHGAGNDFLVLLDPDALRPLTALEVRALCRRRTGLGADGVIRATAGRGGAQLAMELRNADGGVAEMSGNGIRCLVQAAVDSGLVAAGDVAVDTDAGRRTVAYRPTGPGEGYARVVMGMPVIGAVPSLDAVPGVPALRAAQAVDMGNPHLVLLLDGPPDRDVVGAVGPVLEGTVPGGVNVEFVWQESGATELALRVWERGVGETLACGTGTCATAAAARAWGVAGHRVRVRNPGGVLEVELTAEGAVLGGPTVVVGVIDVEEPVLARMAAEVAGDGVVTGAGEVAATR